MPTRFTQQGRRIQIATPLGEDVLLLHSFRGREGVSRLFGFELYMLSHNRSVAFDSVVGKSATVTLLLPDGGARHINGVVSRFSQGGTTQVMTPDGTPQSLTSYTATLVPWLWLLTRTSDCRIFQNQSAPDIVQQVFQDFGFSDFENKLHGGYGPREYCVQYRETYFDFVSRLMEEEGIFYFFRHEADTHTLVLADDPAEFKDCPDLPSMNYASSIGDDATREAVTEWEVAQEVRPGKYTLSDFDFERPTTDLTTQVSGRDERHLELFEYPGGYQKRDDGDRLVGIRMQEQETPLVVARGAGNYAALAPGYKVELKGHYRRDLNAAYVVTSVEHAADLGTSYFSGAEPSPGEGEYSNRFECVPHATPYRPARVTPAPVIRGTQTAMVVGPAGEELYTDRYGRVKVQFHWDRRGRYDENSSCWVRVSQSSAGKRWGSMILPRIGTEVVVDFLEGNPDRPIITGRVYNGGAMPPNELPGGMSKTSIKTYSTKGGGGANELTFDDTKGSEKVYLHSEYDQHNRVKHDRVEWVGNDSHLVVIKDQKEKVDGDKHLKVAGDQNEQVGGGYSLKVGQDAQTKAGMKFAVDAGQEVHLKAGMSITVEAGANLTLKVGGNFISINAGGVFVSGTMVMINSGGAAGSGSGASPTPPEEPLEADLPEYGGAAQLPPPKRPPRPANYSPAALVMRQAAQNGTPFCDI